MVEESGISFVPKHLDVPGRPELSKFPLNVVFASIGKSGGETVIGTAVYDPEVDSYAESGNTSGVRYRNAYGEGSLLIITYDKDSSTYVGEKWLQGQKVNVAVGRDWDRFFHSFTASGVAPGEPCTLQTPDDLRRALEESSELE
jgi:hypothetical protein